MAGIAAFVPVVDRRVKVGIFGGDVIYQDEATARDEDTGHLRDGGANVGIVMRGDTDRDEIEGFVEEGKPLGIGYHKFDVALAARLDKATRGCEHARGEIAGDDAGDIRRDR